MALNTDVLVIGAGPIGLINAWGMKCLNPNLTVVVLEKYSEYQRSHTLVMQTKQLVAIMKATHRTHDPILVALLKQLKKNPHIRTNTLQQIFTQLAQEIGVEIKHEQAVLSETMDQILNEEYPQVGLIIGADGTHSVVSNTLFSEDNQVKHEFDFVLQLRFEIQGEKKAPGIGVGQLYQHMARHGLIASESVGPFEEGKTPVTMQMMISKKDFLALKHFTSKDPLKPYASLGASEGKQVVPVHLNSFIMAYLEQKIRDAKEIDQGLDKETIRISVNEAPATHAKKVVNTRGSAYVVLQGDAALGLSYFKGLNAGLEASAVFLTTLSFAIRDSFQNKKVMKRQLNAYQTWFLKDFSPKKVREVARYSFWQIRSFMQAIRAVRMSKNISMKHENEDSNPVIADYFNYYTRDDVAASANKGWRPFPHREYDLVQFGQFDYVPLKHTAKKIAKIFVDYFKPYKSRTQLIQDFKQPFVGVASCFIGIGKTLKGLVTFNLRLISDGLFSLLRGAIELATTPLTWLLKPMTRGITTLNHGGYKKIEENHGLHHLAQYGHDYLADINNEVMTHKMESKELLYQLRSVCNDIHRKFDKSINRGQATELGMEEYRSYSEIRSDTVLDPKKFSHYFSLFAVAREEQLETKVGTVSEPSR